LTDRRVFGLINMPVGIGSRYHRAQQAEAHIFANRVLLARRIETSVRNGSRNWRVLLRRMCGLLRRPSGLVGFVVSVSHVGETADCRDAAVLQSLSTHLPAGLRSQHKGNEATCGGATRQSARHAAHSLRGTVRNVTGRRSSRLRRSTQAAAAQKPIYQTRNIHFAIAPKVQNVSEIWV